MARHITTGEPTDRFLDDPAVVSGVGRLVQRTGKLLRLSVTTPVLPATAALLCLAAYAGQLGLGRWQSDEFTLFLNQRSWGGHILLPRLTYAPRPFSEGVLFLYGEAVLRLGSPLVVPFLAVLWISFLCRTAGGAQRTGAATTASPPAANAALGDGVGPGRAAVRLRDGDKQRNRDLLLANGRRRVSSHCRQRRCAIVLAVQTAQWMASAWLRHSTAGGCDQQRDGRCLGDQLRGSCGS